MERILISVAALLLVAGAGRLVQLEHGDGELRRDQADRQQTRTSKIPAQRGDILDSRGRKLAGTAQCPSVFMDPTLIENPRAAAELVAPALGLKTRELENLIREKQHRAFVWVKRELTDEELERFDEARRAHKLRAFAVRREPKRIYPYGSLAAHVLGFVNFEQAGQAGIELEFNDALTGQEGERTSTVDARHRRIHSDDGQYVPPVDGANVVLTIDAHIQERTERHLQAAFEEYKPTWAAAIVMDPQSGEILAMASRPDFDPAAPMPCEPDELGREAAEARLRNRVIADSFEPGSIFKPFVAAPAMNAGLVDLDETFVLGGAERRFGSRTIHDVHGYGSLQFFQVISKSSNIGMGLLGERCGNERLNEFVRAFGFGHATGIRLPGEHPGLVQRFDRWTDFSTQSIPIGQEVGVTAIQVVTAFSVLSNGGVLYKPRIVRGVIGPEGETIEDDSRPVVVRQVLDPDVVRGFRERALVDVVVNGTGKPARLPGYQVYGKTGTAQIARLKEDGGGYIPGAFVGSFVAGAPAEDPQVVVLVTVYYPPGGKSYYGSTVAAPTAAAIIADTLEYLGVPPADVKEPDGRG